MKYRCFGVEAVIAGAGFDDTLMRDGVLQIASDLAEGMRALAKSWDNERQLRRAATGRQ